MNLSLEKIKEYFPNVNLRIHDNNDFWRVAKEEKIIVKEERLLIKGYFKIEKKKPIILINSDLTGVEWTVTAFHELSHYLLDVPYKKSSVLLYRDVQKLESKQEQRAEDLGLILTIPRHKLFEMQDLPFDQLDPYSQQILRKRQHTYERNKKIEDAICNLNENKKL